ncbi:2',3'-cyclic-nucleotide 2'-phosphodiesterase [Vibrio astriarenae]|nr:2',3'-cyclic-nucleotide 2'-phosphodiesterase [Vibrio sp. C7]
MEWSYSYFNQYVEGDITVSFNPDMPAFNYDIFGGTIKYVVDLSKQGRVEDSEGNKITDGERIEIVEIAGTDFDADATYTLAVNDYRYGTTMLAKGWITEADNLWQSTNEPVYAVRDMLTAYVDDKELLDRAEFDYQNWYIKQYGIVEADGTITNPGSMIETRQDEGAGQDLWEQLKNKEICILRAEAGARSSIHKAVNINDASTYFANPLFGSAEGDALYQGCIYANQP